MSVHHHAHEHTHDHDHQHDGDTYYLDQICMVGVSGAFGAICLALYLMNASAGQDRQSMLRLLLGPQFHPYVLGSGIALVLVALIRGVSLWRQAGQPGHVHVHDHEHIPVRTVDHDCGHDHAHGSCTEEHVHHHHEHAHTHHHHHDHDAADHDHGWAPWRYVLLLVPIILFLLGLPNKGPEAKDITVHVDTTKELASYAGLIASAPTTEAQLLTWIAALYLQEGNVETVAFKDLLEDAKTEQGRESIKGKTVQVRGQFAASPGSDHVFSLVRFEIACCGADARPIPITVLTRDPLSSRTDALKRNDWVNVTAVVDFQTIGGRPLLLLRVMNPRGIEKCAPDANPYLR